MAATSSGGIQVLHVDDEPSFADLAATYLEREVEGITVDTATSPLNALDEINFDRYDCIVSDYDMPQMDGIELVESVREDHPNLPFILYTGKGSEEVASEAISKGVTEYLQKTTGTGQYEVLANRIENLISRYQAQQEAERTRKRYQRLIEESSDAIVVVDPDGTFSYLSPTAERVLGYQPAELIGEIGFEYIHEADRETAQQRFLKLVDGEQEYTTTEFRFERPDGSWLWIEARGRDLLDDPIIGGIVVYARDISERKVLTDQFFSVLQNLPSGILVETPSRTVLTANERFTELFDLQSSEVVVGEDCEAAARAMKDRFMTPDQFVERINSLIGHPEPVYGDRLELADGRVFERDYLPIELPEGEGIVWIYRDITGHSDANNSDRHDQISNEL